MPEAGPDLVLYDAVVGQTHKDLRVVSELEGTFVELRNRFIHIQDGLLLVDLPNHLMGSKIRFLLFVCIKEPECNGTVFYGSVQYTGRSNKSPQLILNRG